MSTQKINGSRFFFLFGQLNHGVVKGLLFMFTLPFTTAQQGTSSSSTSPPPENFSLGPRFHPSMAIVSVVLVGAFFFMGFFTVYVRQCTEPRYHGANYDPDSAIGGGGGWSPGGLLGLDAAIVHTFPTFRYSTVKGLKIGKGLLECAVCLNEFEDEETLRLIPKCSHVFHPDCIDAWLASHTTCPVCRANLVPEPGDLPFSALHNFEPDNNSAEPDHRFNGDGDTQNHLVIQVADDNTQIREAPQTRSPDVNLLHPAHQNQPPRSWSTGWRFSRLFPRSHSTGHSLVQPGEDCERFTLRLPEEVRSQLMNTQLNRSNSWVAFPRVRSSKRGFRSRSGGSGRGRNYLYHDRFSQEGRPDRWGFSITPPFISRTGSVPSSSGVSGCDGLNGAPLKNLSRSVKLPFDHLFHGTNNSSNNNNGVGERSFDRLRPYARA